MVNVESTTEDNWRQLLKTITGITVKHWVVYQFEYDKGLTKGVVWLGIY